jgi:nucleoside-diphosphate-sugar epimerase
LRLSQLLIAPQHQPAAVAAAAFAMHSDQHYCECTTLYAAKLSANTALALLLRSLQVFNCANTRSITYNALTKAVQSACGKDASALRCNYYDPTAVDAEKGYFPFRNNHFFVSSDKAARLLNWQPKHDLLADLEWYMKG